jgi:hypothetical protein
MDSRRGLTTALVTALISFVAQTATAETYVSLSASSLPPLGDSGEFHQDYGMGAAGSFSVTHRFSSLWELGLETGYLRWSLEDRCPAAVNLDCGELSMKSIPVVAVGRYRLLGGSDMHPYLMSALGVYRTTWGYGDELTTFKEHFNPESDVALALGGGLVVPLSGYVDVDVSVAVTQVWSDPEASRFATLRGGLRLEIPGR